MNVMKMRSCLRFLEALAQVFRSCLVPCVSHKRCRWAGSITSFAWPDNYSGPGHLRGAIAAGRPGEMGEGALRQSGSRILAAGRQAVEPRSIITGAPLMADASGRQRKETRAAISAGSMSRLMGYSFNITSSTTSPAEISRTRA